MKVKRQKRVHRYLNFYRNNFGFRPPWQVIIDGTFCNAALKYQVNIKEQLPKYLCSELHIVTTSCVINEVDKLGQALHGATLILKQFKLRKCGHEREPKSAADCMLSLVSKENNSNHYFIATVDPDLSDKVKSSAGIPLLYLNYNAIIMDKPSDTSSQKSTEETTKKVAPSDYQREIIKKLKEERFGPEKINLWKRKKKSNPNPLSCLKKKKKVNPTADKDKRKRRRKKA